MGQSSNWSPAAGLAAAEVGYTRLYAQCVNSRPEGTIARTFITRIDRPVCFARRWPALTTTGKSGTDQPRLSL